MSAALPTGSVIGILGGGQLGRMLSVAAARLGYRCYIYDPGAKPPAGQVAEVVTTAPWDDSDALKAFCAAVDVITYEFENVPAESLDLLESICPVRPGRRALEISQDRVTEKDFLTGLGLATAPYADCPDLDSITRALERFGRPAILKTRRFGYDGKGQVRIDDDTDVADTEHGFAEEVLGLLEESCPSSSDFLNAYAEVKKRAFNKKQKRKTEEKIEAAQNPQVAAERRMKKQERNKRRKKRRSEELARERRGGEKKYRHR